MLHKLLTVLCCIQRVFETRYIGKPTIIKQRFKKKYRHPTLDAKLTKQRLTSVRLCRSCSLPCSLIRHVKGLIRLASRVLVDTIGPADTRTGGPKLGKSTQARRALSHTATCGHGHELAVPGEDRWQERQRALVQRGT
eukprot:2581881-Pyramimonas_sp.AAC.1